MCTISSTSKVRHTTAKGRTSSFMHAQHVSVMMNTRKYTALGTDGCNVAAINNVIKEHIIAATKLSMAI